MTLKNSEKDRVSPQLHSSGEMGIGWQDICGLDDEDSDESEDLEDESKNNGNSESEDDEIEPVSNEEPPVRTVRNPADPTPEERARHDLTHLPPRPWCPVCVEARAVEDGHYKRTEGEKKEGLPQVCADYAEIGENDENEEDKQKCLIARDKWTKMLHASLVECKGTGDDSAAKNLKEFITNVGYKKLELKTDGEPALIDVAKAVKAVSEADILLRNPPAHDPKANGVAERAVREFKEQLRTVKIALERRLKEKLDPELPILKWMVLHAQETHNRFRVGADGRTPHYRLHHKNFTGKVAEFGEVVHAKPLRKIQGSEH